jgi:hypothetical protein
MLKSPPASQYSLHPNIEGSRFSTANWAILVRCTIVALSGKTSIASARALPAIQKMDRVGIRNPKDAMQFFRLLRARSGHVAAVLPRNVMKSRRRMAPPKETRQPMPQPSTLRTGRQLELTFDRLRPQFCSGSKAPFWPCANHFRSSPTSGRFHCPSACLKGAKSGIGGPRLRFTARFEVVLSRWRALHMRPQGTLGFGRWECRRRK